MNQSKVRIGEAARMLGVSVQTLRNWESAGKLVSMRSAGGHRYYALSDLRRLSLDPERIGFAWAYSAVPPELPREYYAERPDRFTSRVARMGSDLQHSGKMTEAMASLLTMVVGEIGDNSFAHNVGSWPDVGGVFYAYDLDRRIIVLADRGRGVRATLRQVRPDLATDEEALRVAFTEIVSGRNPEKRGNGLKVVRSVVERNPIGLLFRSGTGIVSIQPDLKMKKMRIKSATSNIRGTYAVILF